MAEIINLRTKKRQQARDAARAKGDANALKFGRTKAEVRLQQAQSEKSARDHAAHRLEKDKPN